VGMDISLGRRLSIRPGKLEDNNRNIAGHRIWPANHAQ
jgi:hypothetical protein